MRTGSASEARPTRVALIDALRGSALVGMAIYHFCWDLEFLSLVRSGLTANPVLIAFADIISGCFLCLVGVSLTLAQAGGFRLRSFARRLAMIVAAACAITLASWVFDPDGLIAFGMLHSIAVSSVLGLAFLRMPTVITLIAGAACLIAPMLLRSEMFDTPALLWLGLASNPQPSNDYVPLLPWFGMVLAGIAAARLALPHMRKSEWARWQPRGAPARGLIFAGRHSLIVYLVHQPVLLAILWTVTQMPGAGGG